MDPLPGSIARIIARASAGFGLGLLILDGIALPCAADGIWSPGPFAPDDLGHVLLLSDGTVLASSFFDRSSAWYRLTPSIQGGYTNGTWSQDVAPIHYPRYAFSSVVLRDGRLFVAGGEYGTGGGTAEVYDPVNNAWTDVSPSASYQGILRDSECKVLPDGKVIIFFGTRSAIYDPTASAWYDGGTTHGASESSAVKLPNGHLLFPNPDANTADEYIENTNSPFNGQSVSIATIPANAYLWATLPGYYGEIGPGFLLPNGNVIFFGGTGHTALYDGSSWFAGPDIPNGLVAADAPGAMMANGKILIACAPAPYVPSPGQQPVFTGPTSLFEYDYATGFGGSFSSVYTPGNIYSSPSYVIQFLDLPDGSVLAMYADQRYIDIYYPFGNPLPAGKPTILTVSRNPDGSYHFTGKLFNGISEGASYGDDAQMNTDFPLVRFTDSHGNVRYGRTYNWTGSTVMFTNVTSTECTMPPGASPADTVQVVVNGIASDPVALGVQTTNDSGFGSLRQVLSSVTPVPGPVVFAPNLSGQTITLTNGELLLNKSVTIDASALPGGITLNGNGAGRLFNVSAGATVVLNSLVLTNGYAGSGNSGGGITNSGSLTISNCTLAGNSADPTATGGAICNNGSLRMMNCTLAGNTAGSGGALRTSSACTMQNCTVYGNVASSTRGGGIENLNGVLALVHCTFSGNSAVGGGGGIDNIFSQLNVTNCIVAGNNSGVGQDIYNWDTATITLGGSNIVQSLVNAVGGLFGFESIIFTNPLLGPLADNGGPTFTLLPAANSPAIDAAPGTTLATDQRGLPRIAGPAPDIGAVEYQDALPLVSTNADSGAGSLRYLTMYCRPGSTISFANNLSGQSIVLNNEILISRNLNVDASTLTGGVTIDGQAFDRMFEIAAGVTAALNSLVLTDGADFSGTGGAILNNGNLTLNQCNVWGNQTVDHTDNAFGGGAIYNQSGANLTINQSIFNNNYTPGQGGAIYNNSILTVNQSTVCSNQAFGVGGAIANMNSLSVSLNQSTLSANTSRYGGGIYSVAGSLSVTQSTLSANAAAFDGGGIYNGPFFAVATLDNSIVASNYDSGGLDIYNLAYVIFSHSNIVLGISGGSITGSALAANPLLAPLGNYGGPTPTMPPLPGSPAIDSAVPTGLGFDQRNYPRPLGVAPDIGAVEGIYNSAGPGVLWGSTRLPNGAFHFVFTNLTDSSFTVLASSNPALPLNLWSAVGTPLESPVGSGNFQFTDVQATNGAQRFYRVRSP